MCVFHGVFSHLFISDLIFLLIPVLLTATHTYSARQSIASVQSFANCTILHHGILLRHCSLQHTEPGNPPQPFTKAFEIARACGLHSCPHAGACTKPDSLSLSLSLFLSVSLCVFLFLFLFLFLLLSQITTFTSW